ncbi:MAG: glycosyl hydrolase 2 galactose-binding domain-containing protein [Pelagimonas sp.]|uniref:glycosyl hydrolase 2 galactose-binding domain-containing protein n=1 Tax=Pelagimonas sp. TaxID=2073170 RepID=UPI003D6A4AE3
MSIYEETKSISVFGGKGGDEGGGVMDAPLSLLGSWSVSDHLGEFQFEMDLPGDIVSAMADRGLIPDPYWGQNEYDVRWIADRDWTVRCQFEVQDTAQVLVVSKLDCVARIEVNGRVVLEAQNAFRRYRVDLSEVLERGQNDIAITFASPTKAANAAQDAQPFFVPYTKNFPVPNGNMLRKPQCDFGWD